MRLPRLFIVFCVVASPGLVLLHAQNAVSTTPPPASSSSSEGGNKSPIQIRGDNITSVGDIYNGDGNVVVSSNGETLYADHVIFNTATRFATADGDARLYNGHNIYRGEHMTYNFLTKAVTATTFISQEYPKVIRGKTVSTIDDKKKETVTVVNADGTSTTEEVQHYRLHNASLTTDDRIKPSFHFQATQVEYRPGVDIVMKNVIIYIGDVPVFYVPVLAQSLRDNRPTYVFNLGDSSQFGFFYYNDYNFVLEKNLKADLQLDLRDLRGVGYGLNLDYKPDPTDKASFRGYYTHDSDYDNIDPKYPGSRFHGNFGSSNAIYDGVGSADRYRISFKDHFSLGDDFNTYADVAKWSDPFVTQDFFPGEYSSERQPDSAVAINHYNPDNDLALLIRARTNSFFESADRLPELDFNIKEQPIFNSPIQYQSDSSMVYFDRRFADASNFRNPVADSFYAFNNMNYPGVNNYFEEPAPTYDITQHDNYSAFRYDTYHEFLYPHQYFGFLSLTPRIGGRLTYYSNANTDITASENDNGATNDQITDPKFRYAGDVGLEGDFKISKIYPDVRSSVFGLHELRNVIEPYFNAQFAPEPNVTPNEIRPFDARLISDQLQPINFPDYNSIDSINKQAVVRMGVDNRWQTNRGGGNSNLLDWNSFLDADFYHNFSSTPGHLFSDWFNNINFNPFPLWSYSLQSALGVDGGYNEIQQGVTFQPDPSLSFTVNQNYIVHSVLYPNSDNPNFIFQYRLNEHWQFLINQSMELETGRIQNQLFTLHRDLEAWDAALTYSRQEVNGGTYNKTIYLQMTLKAIPERSLHSPSVPAGGGGSSTN